MEANTIQEETVLIEKSLLQDVVEKLQAQNRAKRDMILPANHIVYEGGLLHVGESDYLPTDVLHSHLGTRLDIPRGYYKKMLAEAPGLLENNVNLWLSRKEKAQWMLRTFHYDDGNIGRALLSNKYNRIDNLDVLIATLEAVKQMGIDIQVVKADITDKKFYLHCVAPDIHIQATDLLDGYLQNRSTAIVDKGIVSGFLLTNSETGMGAMEISAAAQIMRCKNGLIDRTARYKRRHLGAKLEEGDITWSENTKDKNIALIIAQVQDSVKKYLSQDYLGELTTKLGAAKKVSIEHPVEAIQLLNQELLIPEEYQNSVLQYFLQDNDQSALGMLNAVTRGTQSLNADVRYDIEANAFQLLPVMKKFDVPMSTN